MRQHSHCSYCGTPYPRDAPWPRVCAACAAITWRNPLPVGVAMVPVDTDHGRGLVAVRRDIEPARGELALPGGFIEYGEGWEDAVVRELLEETGLPADPTEVRLFAAHSSLTSINIFGLLQPRRGADLPPSAPTDEATEWVVLTTPVPLAFSTHTQAMAEYFASDYFASA